MPAAPDVRSVFRDRFRIGETGLVLTVSLLLTTFALTWAYRVKVVCGGAPFSETGRSARFPVGNPDAIVPCYSDLMLLWNGRGIDQHIFPYIHGGINADGTLFGGVVEYPVLSGLLMWLGAIGADTDMAFFKQSVLLMIPFAVVTTVLLAVMTRWWVLLWAATPPLVLYAFHNWELPVVFTSVAAVAVMAWGSSTDPATGDRRWPLRTTAIAATVLLAIGFSLKIYPGIFVLPVLLYVLTGGEGAARRRALDWVGAAWVAGTAVVTVAATQLPFMIAGYEGWKAALDFQGNRKATVDTNTFWYWGVRHLVGGEGDLYNTVVGVASPLLIIAGFVVAAYLGWKAFQRDGVYPWLGVAAAMLAAFMLFHKVHSPQYTLWILPFFVMLKVRWWIIATYLVSDFVLDTTIFRLFAISNSGQPMKWWVMGGVNFGVWVHAILLAVLIVQFVRTPVREPLASYLTTRPAPDGPLTRLAAADASAARAWLGTPTLTRGHITLRPFRTSDAPALAALVAEPDRSAYKWTGAVPATVEAATEWITTALTTPSRVAFAVLDGDRLVGTTSFYDVDADHRTLAIGYTFYSPAAMGTEVNPTAKLLLLDYAFDECGAVRVVWHTHEDNARSRAAIGKLGAEFEGLLRKHRRFGEGWRTTAQFAMTDDDWTSLRDGLSARAARV